MATKYGEASLAVKYRVKDSKGEMAGGPMYYLEHGLKQKWLGVLFAIFGAFAAFGIGNGTQAKAVADAMNNTFSVPFWVTGIDRKSTRLNSSHVAISYAVFCLNKYDDRMVCFCRA